MPLTEKGEKIKSSLQKEYGEEKGEHVLYAGKNKGTFTEIDSEKGDRALKEYQAGKISHREFMAIMKEKADRYLSSDPAKRRNWPSIDSATISRIANAVDGLERRFDAIVAKKDTDQSRRNELKAKIKSIKELLSKGSRTLSPLGARQAYERLEKLEKELKSLDSRKDDYSKRDEDGMSDADNDTERMQNDSTVSPSEYKRLVKERDEARDQLIAFTNANKNGQNWNLGVFENKYTAACEKLAAAQVKMSKGWDTADSDAESMS